MINRIDAAMEALIIHHIDPAEKQSCHFSAVQTSITESYTEDLLLGMMLDHYKEPVFYTFNQSQQHAPLAACIGRLFEHPESIIAQSIQIANLLFDSSQHQNIKDGDLFVSYIKDVLIEDELVDAICLVKAETLQSIFSLKTVDDSIDVNVLQGIASSKLDKGCVIFNTEKEQGYKICAIDNVNKGSEALFWKNDFLGLQERTDDFYHTKNYIQATKQFIQDRMKPIYETDKTEEATIMNRSLEFLTHEGDFNADEYERKIFKDERVIADFKEYKEDFQNERDVRLEEDFTVSNAAVKNQSRVFKSILKLDKNFHIYIHGNKNMIEKGVDDTGRKFYKLYYNEEN